ncbi:MAG: hypothetical protein CR955_00390 [Thiotrichales bacterium]|nr:MAG: hypothetical protein CR955_00390 [Thiotrichales bacterium]
MFVPLRIAGAFLEPKFSLDLADLIKAVTAQDVERVKQKLKNKTGDRLGNAIIHQLCVGKTRPGSSQA